MISIEYLEKLKKSETLKHLEWMKCKNDPYYWLTNWARTLNVHWDDTNCNEPFPDKEYIKFIVDKWMKNKILIIPKTRQMMLSWLIVALFLWDTQFHRARFTAFQSKMADDADYLVKRVRTIWENEPDFMKRFYTWDKYIELTCNPQNKGLHVYNKFELPMIDSAIIGVPQGGDVIRMHTLSWMFSDEAAFQPEMESAYAAVKPAISHGRVRLTIVSTAEDNTFFQEMVEDTLEM